MNNRDPKEIKSIIEKAKAGDKDAFSFLYKAYFVPVYRYVYFRVGNRDDADDLTQDIFIKAYNSLSRYVYSNISPLAYFYTIARNSIIDHRRKKKMIILDEDELAVVPCERKNPYDESVEKEEQKMVREEIAKLPEMIQDVLVLKFIDDASTKDIVTILGKSEEAIRQIQSRGIRLLRNQIYEKL